jgi:hypothetical protein
MPIIDDYAAIRDRMEEIHRQHRDAEPTKVRDWKDHRLDDDDRPLVEEVKKLLGRGRLLG